MALLITGVVFVIFKLFISYTMVRFRHKAKNGLIWVTVVSISIILKNDFEPYKQQQPVF